MKFNNKYDDRITDILNLIPEDEPVFLIRGQDTCAPKTLDFYAKQLRQHHANHEMAAQVETHANLMRNWQSEHKRKAPDI